MTRTETKFLQSLDILGEEQDTVDLDYLKEVHWERWDKIKNNHRVSYKLSPL